ncbi:unnamed protein product [Pseudo-nitzschia multistriata]|uniref:Methyltransferase domain-containing protein n=1 Tax=Pseudo-nitzschia multistriata TaxID=183589 RepID=A0A448YXQ1_9STRA|nr:unnamed protein product [Pseudo-nitzschia multistriata]
MTSSSKKSSRQLTSAILVALAISSNPQFADAFVPPTNSVTTSESRSTPALLAGFGSSASPSPKNKKKGKRGKTKNTSETPDQLKQRWANKMKKVYGGTSKEAIAAGTEKRIAHLMKNSLDESVQKALELREIVQMFERRITGMGPEDIRQRYSQEELETAIQNRRTFEEHMETNDLTEEDLQVAMQKLTWDASADAKACRSVTGNMPATFKNRVTKAAQVAYEAATDKESLVLDVGCGYGVLVPFLKKAGFKPSQIHGVDLSGEMIGHAKSFYPDVASKGSFEARDFFGDTEDDQKNKYSSVLFCSALHDLPDPKRALLKARDDLLDGKPGSRLVIVHAQGAFHVLNQNKQNPLLVPRGLPTSAELKEWLCEEGEDSGKSSMKLVHEPAEPKSQQEVREGYLAVLETV